MIPGSAIKSDEEIMLDGMSLDELRQQMKLPVLPMDFTAFARMLEKADVQDLRFEI